MPKLNKATATRAADATDQLRAGLTEWFNFYNGYDPMFSWWMGMPYKQANAALQDYATFLREKVAAADAAGAEHAGERAARRADRRRRSSPRCRISREIIALPQDEMRDVVDALQHARRAGNNSGRGGGAARGAAPRTHGRAPPPPPPPDNAFYNAWLTALKTLDFDTLSRNAQVDYLFIKRTAETEIARAGFVDRGQPAAQDRQQRHHRRGPRPERPHLAISATT